MATGQELPPASVSLDLDDVWAYLRTRNESGWDQVPSVLPLVVDRLQPLLSELRLRITIFVVGHDAEQRAGCRVISELAQMGHEIGNHSFWHRADLPFLPADAITSDLERSGAAIAAATGRMPQGFRCPSFGTSEALLVSLAKADYAYDASVLPTTLGPLLRMYFRLRLRAEPHPSDIDDSLYGPLTNALLPLSPFRWRVPGGMLLEAPVSSMPVFRVPIHMSYLNVLGIRSPALADFYLSMALVALRQKAIPLSFLLHPTDVLDLGDAPRLAYFPGMARPWQQKVEHVRRALMMIITRNRVFTMSELSTAWSGLQLPLRAPGRPWCPLRVRNRRAE